MVSQVDILKNVEYAVQFFDPSRANGSIILQVPHMQQLGIVRRRVAELLGAPGAVHPDRFRYGMAFIFFMYLGKEDQDRFRGYGIRSMPAFLAVECQCESCRKELQVATSEVAPGIMLPVPGDDLTLERFFGMSGQEGFR